MGLLHLPPIPGCNWDQLWESTQEVPLGSAIKTVSIPESAQAKSLCNTFRDTFSGVEPVHVAAEVPG